MAGTLFLPSYAVLGAEEGQSLEALSARCSASLLVGSQPGSSLLLTKALVVGVTKDEGGRPNPEHCEIIGELDPQTGVDGRRYVTRFHMRLPLEWNGRLVFQAGGGTEGVIGDAFGNLLGGQAGNALQLGYAVVSQNSGHDADDIAPDSHGGPASFGWDPSARQSYAFRSAGRVTEIAKEILQSYYGRAARYSYWAGCSKGGQEGLAVAAHFPDYFSGVLANAPGLSFPKSVLAHAWDTQIFARLAVQGGFKDAAGAPLINPTFSDADLGLVTQAVAMACDALDGLKDGIIGNFAACTTRRVVPYLKQLRCSADKTAACLSGPQIDAIQSVFQGPHNARGMPLYSEKAWDVGIGGVIGGRIYPDWRRWELGSADGKENDALSIMVGAGSMASLFTTPPRPIGIDAASSLRYLLAFDFDADVKGIDRVEPPFDVSAWNLFSAQSMLTVFRSNGGKLIIVQGVSDPAFSVLDTARWWDRLDMHHGGHAADFARLYAVPGMSHCRGGPGTTEYDAFSALVAWVEKGDPPKRIIARAPANTPWPGRSRPLCPYPQYARYRGVGDVDDAANFACHPGPRVASAK
jgi:feruloyl esterase